MASGAAGSAWWSRPLVHCSNRRQAEAYARRVLPALASRSPVATASAALLSRGASERSSGSCCEGERSVVSGGLG